MTDANKLTLTYGLRGGYATPARLAFAIGKIDFVDERVPPEAADERYTQFPNQWAPALSNVPGYPGGVINQSKAIWRYACAAAGLEPTDPLQGALVDEVVQNLDEVMSAMAWGLEGDALKASREKLCAEINRWFTRIEQMWQGPTFFLPGDKPSRADLVLFMHASFVGSGHLDHVDPKILESFPKVIAMIKALSAIPEVAAFHAQFPQG